jgi:hypothetical protein
MLEAAVRAPLAKFYALFNDELAVRPDEVQQASLRALRDAVAQAGETDLSADYPGSAHRDHGAAARYHAARDQYRTTCSHSLMSRKSASIGSRGCRDDSVKKEQDMTIHQDMTLYPVEFHRRLEQKQILTVTNAAPPPRDPNDDDDDEEEDEDDENQPNEPAVVCEPDED